MKPFAICLACLAALVPVQARKMDAVGANYRKALSISGKPTEEQTVTVDEILADVPGEETTEDSPYKDFDPAAAFKDDSSVGSDVPLSPPGRSGAQDVAIQPSSGLSMQREAGSTLQAIAIGEEPKMPSTLDSIEQTVLNLAETVKKTGKADDAMMEMIASINKILEETIITDLIIQYNEAVDGVFTAQQAIINCVNGSNSSYNPQVDIDDYTLFYYDDLHYKCRQDELNREDLSKKYGKSCDAYKDRCDLLNKTWGADDRLADVDWQQCLVQPGKYHGSMWLGQYYQDQHTFWVKLWEELNRTNGWVDGNCSIWSDCETNKSQAANDSAALAEQCDALQASMDDASCNYKKKIDTEWDIYENCCKSTESECSPVVAKAESDITFLDAQYVATARIQCYMTAFGVVNIEKALGDCRLDSYSTAYAPPNRYPPREYNSVKPFPACPVCPAVPHECGDKMDGYVTGVAVTANNSRYKNMSYIAGTPAYETLHYRPSPVKHLVQDCAASCCPNKCR